MRFSVGAVKTYTAVISSTSTTERSSIRPEHVMASGSLPPGFPAVEIEGEFYWDGGLIYRAFPFGLARPLIRRPSIAQGIDEQSECRGRLPATGVIQVVA